MPVGEFHGFLARHPVFTLAEVSRFIGDGSVGAPNRCKRLLGYHKAHGHLIAVRSGLYAAVPPGFAPDSFTADSFLVASKLTDDAVIAYHTALEFHGVAQSLWHQRVVVTARPLTRPVAFQGIAYRSAAPPTGLVKRELEDLGVVEADRRGVTVRVTSLERSLVDVLSRPALGGGWEEVWRSYETVPYLDLDAVVGYALALDNATTIAQVGYFLSAKSAEWMTTEDHLAPLRARRPKRPHYAQRDRRQQARLLQEWNILLPESAIRRSWEDPLEPIA